MKAYTITEIRTAWSAYKDARALYVLRAGKWELQNTTSGRIEGTRAEFRDVRSMMGFPEYLEIDCT